MTLIRSMSSDTRARTSNAVARAPQLAAFWFGIQLVWGAVLGISLQARCLQLSGSASLATYGEISTAGALAAAITQLLVGPWSDALRRRGNNRAVFYVAGALGGALAICAFYLAPNTVTLLAAFVALQVAMNCAIGPYQAILPDTVSTGRLGGASAWMAAMQSAGNAAGAILATVLGTRLLLGAVIGFMLLAACAVTVAHLREIPLVQLQQQKKIPITRTLVDLFISRAFVYMGFYTLLGYLFFFMRDTLPAHLRIDATTASGIAILLFTLVGTAGAVLAAKPADRIDERLVVTVGGGIVAVAILTLAATSSFIVIPIAIIAAGIGWGIFLCADWAFACRLLPPNALATTMGVWNLAVVGPQMISPAIATTVLTWSGALATSAGPHVAFTLAGVQMLIGAMWIWRLPGSQVGN